MADIREQDLALKTTIADTDWIRLVTPTGNHRMTVGQFTDLIGHIEESGSNSNGRYIRFSDGTMICWGNVSVSSTTSTAWGNNFRTGYISFTFPSSFTSTPECTLGYTPSDGYLAWEVFRTLNSTGGEFAVTRTNEIQVSGSLSFIATGRWK